MPRQSKRETTLSWLCSKRNSSNFTIYFRHEAREEEAKLGQGEKLSLEKISEIYTRLAKSAYSMDGNWARKEDGEFNDFLEKRRPFLAPNPLGHSHWSYKHKLLCWILKPVLLSTFRGCYPGNKLIRFINWLALYYFNLKAYVFWTRSQESRPSPCQKLPSLNWRHWAVTDNLSLEPYQPQWKSAT